MTTIKNFFIVTLVLLANTSAMAKPYFNFDQRTIYENLIDDPFPSDSAEKQNEIEQIIKLQRNLNKDEIEQTNHEIYLRPGELIKSINPELTRKLYPSLYKLMDRTEETAHNIKNSIKDHYSNVARPYKINQKIKLLGTLSDDQSYPSGHATKAYTMAHVLKLLIPDKKRELYDKAYEISYHRVLTGEHFPSDIDAGYKLSLIILGGLLQNSDFQNDFRMAQKELKEHQKKEIKVFKKHIKHYTKSKTS